MSNFVQGATASASNAPSVAFPQNNLGGNILLCQYLYYSLDPVPSAPIDSQGNPWINLPNSAIATANNNATRLYCALNCKAGPNTVTLGTQGGGGFNYSQIAEYSANALATLDNSGVGSTNSAALSISQNIITGIAPNVLVIANLFTSGSTIPNAGSVTGVIPDLPYNQTYPNTYILGSATGPGGTYNASFFVSAASQNSISMISFIVPISAPGSGGADPRLGKIQTKLGMIFDG